MKAKNNLKLVEHTPQDDLDAAIAAEARLSDELTTAQADFNEKFPGDKRLYNLKASFDPVKADFDNAGSQLMQTRRSWEDARKTLDRARRRVAQSGTEKRSILAQAIVAAKETASALSTAEGAIARAAEMAGAAQKKYDDATAAAQSAREQHARNAEEAARTGEPPAAGSLREARSAEADALDDLEAAKSALARIRETATPAADAHRDAIELVARCADDVIMTTAVGDAMARARELTDELVTVRLALRYLDNAGLVLDVDKEAVAHFLHDRELPGRFGDIQYGDWDDDGAAAPWRQVREALQIDANAPLPKI
jgi:chromosome segregation ATPase